jgi:ABC-type bacteriocin/lantibiotic exporter with double-glycine peptidase domain
LLGAGETLGVDIDTILRENMATYPRKSLVVVDVSGFWHKSIQSLSDQALLLCGKALITESVVDLGEASTLLFFGLTGIFTTFFKRLSEAVKDYYEFVMSFEGQSSEFVFF